MKSKKFKKSKQPQIPDVKCRLCGEIIKVTKWRKHLEWCHKVGEKPKLRDFYVGCNVDLEKAQREWFNPNKVQHEPTGLRCGTVVDGPPKIKIIYNSTFSSRKKF